MTKKLDPQVKLANELRRKEERARIAAEKAQLLSAKKLASEKIKKNTNEARAETKRLEKESRERVEAAARAKNVEDAIFAVKAVKARQDKKRAASKASTKTPEAPKATRQRKSKPAPAPAVRPPKAGAPAGELGALPLTPEQQALYDSLRPSSDRPDMSEWTPEEKRNYRKRKVIERHFEIEARRRLREALKLKTMDAPTKSRMGYEKARRMKTTKFTDLMAKKLTPTPTEV